MNSFADFFAAAARKAEDPTEKDEIYRLRRMAIDSVHLVDAGANKRTFLIRKDKEGPTMKTEDMIPEVNGFQTSEGVVITKADAMVGASDDLQKLIKQMEEDEENKVPPQFLSKLKTISKVLTAASSTKKAAPPPAGGAGGAAAEDDAAMSEEDKKKKTQKAEGAEGAAVAPAAATAAAVDPFDMILGQIDGIQKAGKRMSKGNMEIFSKAMEMLQKLADNLTPEEKAEVQEKVQEKVKAISKSLTPAAAAHVPDGNSKPNQDPVKPEPGGWSSYEDINA